ncbi:MAG: amidohydrolase family protein [Gammaproteobacteria bacterium]
MTVIRTLARWLRILGQFFTRTKTGRILVFLSLPLAILVVALWEPDYYPPIFDAQVHYNESSWWRVSVDAVINTADELNVPWMLVGSTPNEGTWRLYRRDPQRVIPMFIPYRHQEDNATWFNDENLLHYMEREIRHRNYRGIGEFHLFDGQVDTPVVHRMVELALEHNLILHARSDPNAIRQLFVLAPSLRILWAHAGLFSQPETLAEMLKRYPRLWVEISHRGDVAPGGKLAPQWRELMLLYPDRFLLGTGTYNNENWYQFRYTLSRYRKWLNELPPDVAAMIAYRNGLVLFELERPQTPD